MPRVVVSGLRWSRGLVVEGLCAEVPRVVVPGFR